MASRRRALLTALAAWLVAGCTAGEVVLYEPEGSGLTQGLTVRVELDSEAAEIGEALGWTDGVPDAEVRVHRIGTAFEWRTALTDSSGEARFPDLLPGMYRVAGYRVLTDDEAAQLGDRRRAFGDGSMVYFSEAGSRTLRVAPDKRGSLLISENYGTAQSFTITGTDWRYQFYLEVYNNSDTTIYLDGKILGQAYDIDRDYSEGYFSCAQTERFRNDPAGVWSRYFHRFPGSGTEYPLAPGEIAVVAVDAIDHSQIYPAFPDLSNADFELLGPADVDNPSVPNMPEIGLASFYFGHGLLLYVSHPYFLSEPVDLETLPREWDEGGRVPHEYVRFPRSTLLDVLATDPNDTYWDQRAPPCSQDVHRNFDRLPGGFIEAGPDFDYSVQRVVIDTTPDGRAILQDTNTSAVDLMRAFYTVGTLRDGAP